MGLFSKLFGGKKMEVEIKPQNRLDYNTSGRAEYGFYQDCYAEFSNGVVYNCCVMPSVKPIKIGFYEKNSDGTYTVWNMNHDERIGVINAGNGDIEFSVVDTYIKVKKNRPYLAAPKRMTWRCAKVRAGDLFDLDNGFAVGRYTGDAVGAAAAFVCLSCEYIQDGKFHDFFDSWL